jgi:hypothetical protein
MNSLDDLELELRKLPGVKAAGFDEREDMLLVQLHVGDRVDSPEHSIPIDASRIVARHIDERAAVEIVRWRTMPAATVASPSTVSTPVEPSPVVDLTTAVAPTPGPEPQATTSEPSPRRARLLAVLAFPDTNELEVHLILDGRRTIGRAVSSDGLIGAVEATLEATREMGAPFRARPLWARAIESIEDDRIVVGVALDDVVTGARIDYGLAAGASAIDAAARATLDALNRRLAQVL